MMMKDKERVEGGRESVRKQQREKIVGSLDESVKEKFEVVILLS